MATRPATVTRIDSNTVKFFWETLTTTNNDGTPIPSNFADYADRTMQVTGTLGVGGNLRIEGSLDGTNYAALNDPFGTALNVTAAGIKGVTENTLLTRPNVTAGDGTTDLDVTIICRRNRDQQGG